MMETTVNDIEAQEQNSEAQQIIDALKAPGVILDPMPDKKFDKLLKRDDVQQVLAAKNRDL